MNGGQGAGCPECVRSKGEFVHALRTGDRAEGERVMAARGLHLYVAHWGPGRGRGAAVAPGDAPGPHLT
ncbi:hypothetical protein [Streptomyces huiliensis]|uniref:hypothetical protein n=1 Tax=Streptomyces huiliensis TaxID=2876027 RepID=UPI001CC18308|nr:hypothetical protein [Streptomyces huiliensis]MBZ4318540.1 hypothetical protein [Streptomyces huiliensis]